MDKCAGTENSFKNNEHTIGVQWNFDIIVTQFFIQ